MVDVNKLSIQTIDQITCFNNANELEFIMDEVQNGNISNTQEKTDITGRGGRKIGSLKKNKAVTITATNGLLVGGALAAQTGTEVEQGQFKVRVTDVITVDGTNKGKSTYKAVGVSGNEVGAVYKKNANGSLGDKLTQNESADETHFQYDPGTKEFTFHSDVADGTEFVAFYDVMVNAAKISNDSEKYSKTLKMYIDVTAVDNCDNQYHGQFIIQRADFSGEFEIAMGDDPAVHNIEAESLAGGCTGSTNLWDFIIYGDDAFAED